MRKLYLLPLACLVASSALAGAYNDAGPSVLQIHIEGRLKVQPVDAKTRDFKDDATGFVVSADGLVMTAGHVIPAESDFEEGTLVVEGRLPHFSGKALVANEPPLSLEVLKGTRTPYDAGLFRITNPGRPLPYLRLCDDYEVDDQLIFLGYVDGERTLSRRQGSVAQPANDPAPLRMQISMAPGDSGGPVFNPKGSVIAIGIGQLKLNNQRVETTNLAVMVRNAIHATSHDSDSLIGTSYDPDCGKKLDPTAGAPAPVSGPETLKQFSSALVEPGGSDQVTIQFERPGFVFTDFANARATSSLSSVELTPPNIRLLNSGRVLEMTLTANGKKTSWPKSLIWPDPPVMVPTITGEISAQLKAEIRPAITASAIPEPHVESFLVSKTLDVHAEEAARQKYSDSLTAPNGYRFLEVLKTTVVGSSNVSVPIEASVMSEGSFIQVTYELQSGPRSNPWTAWIDAFVTASLAPIERRPPIERR